MGVGSVHASIYGRYTEQQEKVNQLAANLAATNITTPAAGTAAAPTTPAPTTPAADTKKEDEPELAISAIDGLHPKDAEAQVEMSANAGIYKSIKSFKELPLYVLCVVCLSVVVVVPRFISRSHTALNRSHSLCTLVCRLNECLTHALTRTRPRTRTARTHSSPQLLDGVYGMKFTSPSKIQAEALPIILRADRPNFIGQAHHGSGKTASYSLSMLSIVDEKKAFPQAICIVPVRELAIQVFDVLSQLGKFTQIKIRKAIPGEEQGKVTEQIVVGTPGSLLAKLKHNELDPRGVAMFVADEADVMISRQGLGEHTLMVKAKLTNPKLQVLLFSATFPTAVRKFAEKVAPKAVSITVKREELSLDAIKQFFVDTKTEPAKYDKLVLLYALLQIGQAIVFVQTVKTAKEITNKLRKDGYAVSLLHGKDMKAPERDAVMKDFRTGKTTVLITTNVLARGIDVLSVTLVVNFDVPLSRIGEPDPETYIHRIGRSGRFGRPGVAINFVHDAKSKTQLAKIAMFFNCPITELNVDDLEGTEKIVKEALAGKGSTAAPSGGAAAGSAAAPAPAKTNN